MEEDIFLSVTKFLDSQEIEYSLNNDSILLNIQSTDPKEVILKFKKPKNSLEFIISDLSIPSYSEYPKNLILSLAKENEFLFIKPNIFKKQITIPSSIFEFMLELQSTLSSFHIFFSKLKQELQTYNKNPSFYFKSKNKLEPIYYEWKFPTSNTNIEFNISKFYKFTIILYF